MMIDTQFNTITLQLSGEINCSKINDTFEQFLIDNKMI